MVSGDHRASLDYSDKPTELIMEIGILPRDAGSLLVGGLRQSNKKASKRFKSISMIKSYFDTFRVNIA